MSRWRNILAVLLALATVAGTWGELRILARSAARRIRSWSGRTYCSVGDYIDLPRQMLETHLREDSRVYLVCDGLDSISRSRQIALSWAASPLPVRFGPDTEIGDATLVFSDAYRRNPQFEIGTDGDPAFRLVDEGGGMRLWERKGIGVSPPRPASAVSPGREAVGVAVVGLLVLAFGWFAVRGGGGAAGWGAWPCAAVVLLVAGGLALAHTFVAPTGLGVWGGKAKLLYLCDGLPDGFFTDPARATLQPAYPPGLALLTLLAYAVSGGCGEWLAQLVVVFAASALCALICSRTESWPARLWVLAAFLRPWDYAFAWPLTALLLAFAPLRRFFAANHADLRGLRAAAVAASAASAAFVYVLSLSRAPDFGWHLSTALPRLLWIPSLLLLVEIAACWRNAENLLKPDNPVNSV